MQFRESRAYGLSLSVLTSLLALLLVANSCTGPEIPAKESINNITEQAIIFPDYDGITIPPDIAPLNFTVKEDGTSFIAILEGKKGGSIQLQSRNKEFRIPAGKWKKLLMSNRGSQLTIRILRIDENQWSEFLPIINQIAPEPINSYLAYRLIPPGYQTWSEMGLFQRDLSSFKETPIIRNQQLNNNCVNCHSFCNWDSENMMFHIRGSMGGTMLKLGKEIEKVNTKTEETLSAGVYPSWHPSGNYVAFSTNKIEQYFHADPRKTIEVYDRNSDLIVYNTKDYTISHVPGTRGNQYMETFPCWSPDGKFLYFSRTDADSETPFDSIRYDIYRIEFNLQNGNFGETEAVLEVSGKGLSASFPKISPDGNYLLCTVHNYGTFPIWHKEADLCLVDLRTGISEIPEINSDNTDSYHAWSSNNRWIVFSSRRYDGRYTKLYISYMNEDGEFQKAFLLPQDDPGFYDSFFFSYNVPELFDNAVRVNPRRWSRIASRSDNHVVDALIGTGEVE